MGVACRDVMRQIRQCLQRPKHIQRRGIGDAVIAEVSAKSVAQGVVVDDAAAFVFFGDAGRQVRVGAFD